MLNLASRSRPYLGALILSTGLLTAGGIYSATQMPESVYPEVTFPRIAVVAKKPGLSVNNMEVQVTRPLEDAVSAVIGVTRVRSKSLRGGCDLSIDLAPGTDIRRAEQMTWNRIGAARSLLPPDVELTVEQMTPSVFPILSLVLTGGDSPAALYDYAYYQLRPRIKKLPDVLFAEVAGGDIREIEVEARPDDLLAASLSAADLADQIGKANRLEPVGRVERRPFAFQVLVNTQGETARDIGDLIITSRNNQPLRVRDVADVKAAARDRVNSIGFEGRDAVVVTVFRRPNGNTVTVSEALRDLLQHQSPPGNIKATVVYDQARFVHDAVNNVRDAILVGSLFSVLILLAFLRSIRATLVAALALPTTLAITFLFLHWSGETLNLMSLGGLAVAIGLIIDDTVVVIENIARHLTSSHTHKVSATTPSPLGPVPRGEGMGVKGAEAAKNPSPPSSLPGVPGRGGQESETSPVEKSIDPVDAASGEITGAVVGSTLTTVLVFVPLAFIVGVYGQFFASLSWSLSIAVLVSMVISLTLVPVAAARFLSGRPMPEPGIIYRSLAFLYEKLLEVALYFPRATVFLSLAAVGVGILLCTGITDLAGQPLMPGLKTGLMPAMDEGAFVLDYLAPSGTPLEHTEEMARTLEELLQENPDVQSYVRRTGTQLGLFATETNRGDIQVILRPTEDDPLNPGMKPMRPAFSEIEEEMKTAGQKLARERYGPKFTEEQAREEGKAEIRRRYRRRPLPRVMEEINDEVKEHFGEHQLNVETVPIMEDELNDLSGANKPIEVKLFGPDYRVLRENAEKVGEMLEKNGKESHYFDDVRSGVYEGNPDLMVQIDEVQATRLGLSVQEVERQLKAIFVGQVATQLRESSERITDVRVRYPDVMRFGHGDFNPSSVLESRILLPGNITTDSLASTVLTGPNRSVPLSVLARVERVRTPEEQVRENLQPAVIVTAELADQASLGSVVSDVRKWMSGIHLPSGYRWELGGHYVNQREAFRSLTIVMTVAILLVFIMLAFQFQSLSLPVLIFLTQPLSLVSGLFALWLTNTPLNVSSYMGAILLIGLDMKNGILLVEYIQQLRAEGMELRAALLLAGRTRFRPILMTSLAAILGLLPLALGIGPGAQMQQPLAIMVIGGLTANMLFTRVVIPAGYLLMEGRKQLATAGLNKKG